MNSWNTYINVCYIKDMDNETMNTLIQYSKYRSILHPVSKAWSIIFLSAVDCCCPKTIKNASMRHAVITYHSLLTLYYIAIFFKRTSVQSKEIVIHNKLGKLCKWNRIAKCGMASYTELLFSDWKCLVFLFGAISKQTLPLPLRQRNMPHVAMVWLPDMFLIVFWTTTDVYVTEEFDISDFSCT